MTTALWWLIEELYTLGIGLVLVWFSNRRPAKSAWSRVIGFSKMASTSSGFHMSIAVLCQRLVSICLLSGFILVRSGLSNLVSIEWSQCLSVMSLSMTIHFLFRSIKVWGYCNVFNTVTLYLLSFFFLSFRERSPENHLLIYYNVTFLEHSTHFRDSRMLEALRRFWN